MAGTNYAEKEREAPASKLAELRPKAVPQEAMQQEARSAVGQQQQAAQRVVGMAAQLFAGAISEDPKLKMAVRDSQLNTLLEMVKS